MKGRDGDSSCALEFGRIFLYIYLLLTTGATASLSGCATSLLDIPGLHPGSLTFDSRSLIGHGFLDPPPGGFPFPRFLAGVPSTGYEFYKGNHRAS